MRQVIYDKTGRVKIKEVPAPAIEEYEVLVKNEYSVLSAGTEKSMIDLMKKPLWKMAIERPDLTSQVIRFAKDSGIKKTMDLVRSRLDVWHLLGYSSAGTVVKVGSEIDAYSIGDRVACIGSGFANHAEFVAVPQTMIAKIPKGVKTMDAAFTGIACIALQSIRQLDPQLGESIAVVGLGLIGQMVAQMLSANGCRVIGIDIDKKKTDRRYIDEAITENTIKGVLDATKGLGADGVIIAAATKHNLINDAFDICRKKGRVVLLGVCGMEIDRQKMFEKELEFKISTAFGTGAFDADQLLGKEYPIEHVRWTSQRNMDAVLSLMQSKRLDMSNISENKVYPIKDAKKAYDEISRNKKVVLFEYKNHDRTQTIVSNKDYRSKNKIRVGLIGAGNFVKGFIIPALKSIGKYSIYGVATKTGTNAKSLAKELGAKYATTDYKSLLSDKNIDLIIIGTRHDTHARIASQAISAGKHVFCEKPMALTEKELKMLAEKIRRTDRIYTCGFNRRYSPCIKVLKKHLKEKPMMINYVFNNTFLPKEHWVNEKGIGGGRIIGEACHIFDLFNYFTGSRASKVSAYKIATTGSKSNDFNNLAASVKFEDGSIANLTYSCIGNSNVSRERCTIIQDGDVFEMDNFSSAYLNSKKIFSSRVDEGHTREFAELEKAIRGKKNFLASADDCIDATRTTFAAIKATK